MTRADLIDLFVLNEICDDYEDVEQITKGTVHLGSRCGLNVSRDDIIRALRDLIELGYVKAWDLRRWADSATTENKNLPPREDITPLNPRFSRTEEGLAFRKASSASGPFDGEAQRVRERWLAAERMLTLEELVGLFILDSFANCTHVCLAHIELHSNRHGVAISRVELIQAFRELTRRGYLKASYRDECWQYKGMPPLEDVKPFGAYFWITGDGWDFKSASESWWPFDVDDDGESNLTDKLGPT